MCERDRWRVAFTLLFLILRLLFSTNLFRSLNFWRAYGFIVTPTRW